MSAQTVAPGAFTEDMTTQEYLAAARFAHGSACQQHIDDNVVQVCASVTGLVKAQDRPKRLQVQASRWWFGPDWEDGDEEATVEAVVEVVPEGSGLEVSQGDLLGLTPAAARAFAAALVAAADLLDPPAKARTPRARKAAR